MKYTDLKPHEKTAVNIYMLFVNTMVELSKESQEKVAVFLETARDERQNRKEVLNEERNADLVSAEG